MSSRRHVLAAAAAMPALLTTGRAHSAMRARVGLSLPLTGVQSAVATDLLTGYQLAFRAAKAQGIDIEAVVIDDHSQPAQTEAAVRQFAIDRSIVAASGIVGTPHAKAAIPAARTGGLPILGLRSGSSDLRDGGELVYHLRASFEDELTRMVRMLDGTFSRIAIIASDDSFGVPAAEHARKEATARGMRVLTVARAERNGRDIQAVMRSIAKIDTPVQALLVLVISRPAIEALRTARANSFGGPIFTMSFTAGSELLGAGPRVFAGLGMVLAFPVARTALDNTTLAFAQAARQSGRPELVESVTACEGYWYGAALAQAVRQCDGVVNRERFVAALEGGRGLRLGTQRLSFGERRVGRHELQVVHVNREGLMQA